jgi:hypothetical protein
MGVAPLERRSTRMNESPFSSSDEKPSQRIHTHVVSKNVWRTLELDWVKVYRYEPWFVRRDGESLAL